MTSALDIFISYSRDDQPVARRYADALKAEGFDANALGMSADDIVAARATGALQ